MGCGATRLIHRHPFPSRKSPSHHQGPGYPGWGTVTCLAPVEWAIRKLGYSASICIHAPLFPAVSVNPGTRLLRTVRPRSPELWPASVSARRTQSSRHTLTFSPSPSSLACDDSAPSPGIGPRSTRGCANVVWRFIVIVGHAHSSYGYRGRHPHKHPHNATAPSQFPPKTIGFQSESGVAMSRRKSFNNSCLKTTPEYQRTSEKSGSARLITQRSKVQILPPQPKLLRLYVPQNQRHSGQSSSPLGSVFFPRFRGFATKLLPVRSFLPVNIACCSFFAAVSREFGKRCP